jgi:hypothetical protein
MHDPTLENDSAKEITKNYKVLREPMSLMLNISAIR